MASQTLQNDLLTALEKNEQLINSGMLYSDSNSDQDFGVVLNEFSSNEVHHHFFRYSDGSEEEFTFDN